MELCRMCRHFTTYKLISYVYTYNNKKYYYYKICYTCDNLLIKLFSLNKQ